MAAETADRRAETDHPPELAAGLAGYVRAVAVHLAVPVEATGFEISDTATVYIGLSERWSGRDLMLEWGERHGWYVAVETWPAEPAMVLGYFGGDLVPQPAAVSRFVAEVIAGRHPATARPVFPVGDNRRRLAALLQPYRT